MGGRHKSIPCRKCGGRSRVGRCWGCYLEDSGKQAVGGYPDHLVYEIDPVSGCWVWGGPPESGGYGRMKSREKAHRYSWRLHNGPIPNGLHVLHECDNPPCVNPDHLFLGTHQDNMADMKRKGRAAMKPGELNINAKLTAEQALAIKQSNEVGRILAARYGINVTTVNKIKRGEKWAHLHAEASV